MMALLTKAGTALALGVPNVLRVAQYRMGVKLGLHAVCRIQAAAPQAPFFNPVSMEPVGAPQVVAWETQAALFGHHPFAVSRQPPDWLAHPLNGRRVDAPERDWWKIPDFDPAVGDIKPIWELSRMDWVLALAQSARNGNHDACLRLNAWLGDWCAKNAPYRGPNWKCGQEASIRVMHLSMAALILGQVLEPTTDLRDLIRLHLQRIAPTLPYAMAQDNNHGTSEATALFIGGSWLAALGEASGEAWHRTGRRWLENRVVRLIGSQGTFSQYSLNYQRVVLDTLCIAEVWRRHCALPAFSAQFQSRALAATQWLRRLVNPINGDGPNVGANDGARLLPLADTAYRDHRPSVQLAMALFAGQRAYAADGPCNHALRWLGIALPHAVAPDPQSYVADDGGFAVLRHGAAMALLRYPRFRFRPSQSDALHVDFWLGGDNVLRDGGSYSYNAEQQWMDYFGGTASHNTVQFDDRDQMPRLTRFLFGRWLKTHAVDPLCEDAQAVHFGAGYRDGRRAHHHRRIRLDATHLQVIDAVAGFGQKAVLRWRLTPGHWRLEGQRLTNGSHVLSVQASMPVVRCELLQGWESRHYLEKTPLPVLEIEVRQGGTLTSEYRWAP